MCVKAYIIIKKVVKFNNYYNFGTRPKGKWGEAGQHYLKPN